MEKMDGMSMDLTATNIEKLKELFPNAVSEGKIDFDMLRTMLGDEVDTSKEKYQFTWNGKAESIKLAQSPSLATLRPCKEKSKDWDTTENLYIEGDNLEVLKQLQKTYFGKVKMIYIDPPYNTGHDFVYKDDFKDSIENYIKQTNQTQKSNPETSGRFHSDWLSMMYSRLIVARNLMTEDGVLFISIDQNEEANLTNICNEIFGESNLVAKLAVQVNPRGRNLDRYVAKTYEPVFVYVKNYSNGNCINYIAKDERMLSEYNREDEKGAFRLIGLRNRNQAFNPTTRPSLYFPLFVDPSTGKVFLEQEQPEYIEVFPVASDETPTCWTWSKPKIKEENDYLFGEETSNGWRIFRKDYLEEGTSSKTMIKSLLLDPEFNNDWGKKRIKELFGENVMSFPKSPLLMKRLLELGTHKDSFVLDFFSGSATTADAIMQMNSEDNGRRKFIMVQLPEITDVKSEAYIAGYKTICDIGEERIHRAGEKIKSDWESQNESEGLLADKTEEFNVDIGFKVFQLDSTNINPWDNTKELDEKSLFDMATIFKQDRSKEDVLYEIMLKYGVFDQSVTEVVVNKKTMYRVGQRHMIVCLEDKIDDSDITEICKLKPRVVVFKEDGFKDDNAKINADYNLKKVGVEDVKCI